MYGYGVVFWLVLLATVGAHIYTCARQHRTRMEDTMTTKVTISADQIARRHDFLRGAQTSISRAIQTLGDELDIAFSTLVESDARLLARADSDARAQTPQAAPEAKAAQTPQAAPEAKAAPAADDTAAADVCPCGANRMDWPGGAVFCPFCGRPRSATPPPERTADQNWSAVWGDDGTLALHVDMKRGKTRATDAFGGPARRGSAFLATTGRRTETKRGKTYYTSIRVPSHLRAAVGVGEIKVRLQVIAPDLID